jgi:hypothetical protein
MARQVLLQANQKPRSEEEKQAFFKFFSSARQGSCMTCRCEFGVGNRGFARLAMGTVSGSNSLAEAVQMRARRRQHKRTRCSTVSVVKEGRARRRSAKTITASHPKSNCDVASSVSRRPHAGKAI